MVPSNAFWYEDISIMSNLEQHMITVLCILTDYGKATVNLIHK